MGVRCESYQQYQLPSAPTIFNLGTLKSNVQPPAWQWCDDIPWKCIQHINQCLEPDNRPQSQEKYGRQHSNQSWNNFQWPWYDGVPWKCCTDTITDDPKGLSKEWLETETKFKPPDRCLHSNDRQNTSIERWCRYKCTTLRTCTTHTELAWLWK